MPLIFSMIHKIKLVPKGTLSSILTVKLANGMSVHHFEPTKDHLKTAKSATWKYNKKHSSHYGMIQVVLLSILAIGQSSKISVNSFINTSY